MKLLTTCVLLFLAAGCSGAGGARDDVDSVGRGSTIPTPHFNGAFDRAPTAAYFEPAAGWSVEPTFFFAPDPTTSPPDLRLHPTAHGHGGVFFQADAGRNGGVALYFQLCYTTRDPQWCEGPIVVSSQRFAVSGGTPYRMGLWFRSTIFLHIGGPNEHRTRLSVRYYDSTGTSLSVDGFTVEPNEAPVDAWTANFLDVMVPGNAVEARIEVGIDRNHQSHVYIDDVTFTPI